MQQDTSAPSVTKTPSRTKTLSRRDLGRTTAGLAATAALAPVAAFSQTPAPVAALGTPPSVISNPPRQWGRHASPNIYPDPDVVVIDPTFRQYIIGITSIHRVATGFMWAEGPAWSNQGQYLLFSDVQG